jgi:hypothetical protein
MGEDKSGPVRALSVVVIVKVGWGFEVRYGRN